jgi:hypothetical protein
LGRGRGCAKRWVEGLVWEGRGVKAYLFLVMQTLVVVFKDGLTFRFAAVVLGGCVCDVAGEDFLPEGEAAGRAYEGSLERRIVTCMKSEKGPGEAGDSGSSGKA